MEWITIKEVCNLTRKSESTIRNLARQLKKIQSKDIKFQQLKTGHNKILFSLKYINSQLLSNKTVERGVNKNSDSVEKFIQVLEKQLIEKDKQIEQLHQNLQAQNLLLHNLQESIKLIEQPKKKGWFRWRK